MMEPQRGAPVVLRRRANAPTLTPPATGWPYLDTPPFRVRGAIAAHFVRDCGTVIEVGGGRTPLDTFLAHDPLDVVVLDPFIADAERAAPGGGTVRHVRGRFQDVDWEVRRPHDFGLVFLGLELLDLNEADQQALVALIDAARRTVIEFPSTYAFSRGQYAMIRARTATREAVTAKLDLSGNDLGRLERSWPAHPRREFHVLEPQGGG